MKGDRSDGEIREKRQYETKIKKWKITLNSEKCLKNTTVSLSIGINSQQTYIMYRREKWINQSYSFVALI